MGVQRAGLLSGISLCHLPCPQGPGEPRGRLASVPAPLKRRPQHLPRRPLSASGAQRVRCQARSGRTTPPPTHHHCGWPHDAYKGANSARAPRPISVVPLSDSARAPARLRPASTGPRWHLQGPFRFSLQHGTQRARPLCPGRPCLPGLSRPVWRGPWPGCGAWGSRFSRPESPHLRGERRE